jgi:hypothetical protein
MAQSRFLNRVIGIASALMLVVAVLSSPIRLPRSHGGHVRPDCLRRNVRLSAKQSCPARPTASSLGSAPVRVKAIASESEKDVVKLTCGPGHFLHAPPVLPPIVRPARFAVELVQAVHPLRC